MENEINKEDFQEGNYCPLKIFKNNNVVIESFNSNENIQYQKENSRIKQNQIGVIKKFGCIFIFNYNKIIFFDNEKMGLLLEKVYGNEDEEVNYFKINEKKLFILNFNLPIINVFLDSNEKNIFVFQNDDDNKKTIVQSFIISNLMIGNVSVNSSITLDFEIMSAICFDNNFYILNSNKDLLVSNLSLTEINQISQNVENFNYNNYNDSLIYNTNNQLFLKIKNTTINFQLSQIFNLEEEEIIYLENINNLIIIYTISKNDRSNNDKLYEIELNENNEIIKIFLDEDIFFPDEYENDGISVNSLHKRSILTAYNENFNLFFLCNKQGNQIEKIYNFEEDEDPKIFNLDDDKRITSLNKTAGENNTFIGICKIDFEFNKYEGDKEIIDGTEYGKPSLFISCGYLGGINLYYLTSENREKLNSRNEFESYKFPNLSSNINIVDDNRIENHNDDKNLNLENNNIVNKIENNNEIDLNVENNDGNVNENNNNESNINNNENNIENNNNENINVNNNNQNINNSFNNSNKEVIEKQIKEENKIINNQLNLNKEEKDEEYEVKFKNQNDNEIDTSSSNKPQTIEIKNNIQNKNIKNENNEKNKTKISIKEKIVDKNNENENNKSNSNKKEEDNNKKVKSYNNFDDINNKNKNNQNQKEIEVELDPIEKLDKEIKKDEEDYEKYSKEIEDLKKQIENLKQKNEKNMKEIQIKKKKNNN